MRIAVGNTTLVTWTRRWLKSCPETLTLQPENRDTPYIYIRTTKPVYHVVHALAPISYRSPIDLT